MTRLPIIRHVRWFYLSIVAALWLHRCQQSGLGLFLNPSDAQYLNDVWSGKA